MIDLKISREEQIPEGTVSLDCVIGIQPDGSPLLARHLLAELDIASVLIASLFSIIDHPTPEQVRADLVAERMRHEDAAC